MMLEIVKASGYFRLWERYLSPFVFVPSARSEQI
jgi:hypothetical protein